MIRDSKIVNSNFKIASIHIPKTAGTSFRNILKTVYGYNSVIRVDIRGRDNNVFINKNEFTRGSIKDRVNVIHGHFSYSNLIDVFSNKSDYKVVTWLRNPVDRVISNYFYLEKILRKELMEEKKGLNILSKMQKSLIEYSRADINRNRMSRFLKGADINDLFFVGLYESYEEDLEKLRILLDWPYFNIPKHNVTGDKRIVEDDIIEEIRELNKEDFYIYDMVKRMKDNNC